MPHQIREYKKKKSCIICGNSLSLITLLGKACEDGDKELSYVRETSPLDFECPTCGALPGEPCMVRPISGGIFFPTDYSMVKPTKTHRPRIEERRKEEEGCFLTTACVEHAGLPDDCYQLTILRSFRDSYIAALPDGSEILAEYYNTAPFIVHSIQHSPDRDVIFANLFERISDIIRLIKNGFYEEALSRYSHIFNGFKRRYQHA